MSVSLCFKKKDNSVVLPSFETPGSAGADIRAHISSPIVIECGKHCLIPTGLYPEIPSGYEIQIRPRSGLAYRSGVTVLNTPGTIDSDYRGEIMVNIVNLGDAPFMVSNGDRIAQMVFSPVIRPCIVEVQEINKTERGDGGFGSTGVR